MKNNKTIKTAGLFSGIGAINVAYNNLAKEYNTNIKDLFGCDICDTAANTYKLNHNPDKYFYDINDIKHEKKNIDIDILITSAPCKPFSLALNEKYREDKLKSDEAFLSYETINLLNSKKLKTKYLIFENVPNLISLENGKTWNDMLKAFKNLKDYHKAEWKIIDSSYFSATTRKRVFLVLTHKDIKNPYKFPKMPKEKSKSVIKDHLRPVITDYYNMNRPYTRINQNKIPESGIIQYGKINYSKFNQTSIIYDIKGKCPTITASHSPWIYDEDKKIPRSLTIQEIKSIMGYPKDFKLNCSKSLAIEKIGNSIEIRTLEYILRPIFQELLKIK